MIDLIASGIKRFALVAMMATCLAAPLTPAIACEQGAVEAADAISPRSMLTISKFLWIDNSVRVC